MTGLNEIENVYGETVEFYDLSALSQIGNKKIVLNKFADMVKDLDGIILDIGAGTGKTTIEMANMICDKEIIALAGITESSKEEIKKKADEKLNPLQALVKTLSNLFVPILPALIASGLLMGINNVLTSQDLFIQGKSIVEAYPQIADLARLINTFANAAYVFLPILIAFSATKLFGGNPYLGACIGALMIH